RPILSKACFACHGPDAAQREAELRLDLAESAQSLQRDRPAIVPGKPEESELVHRINSDDPDVRMPPPRSKKELTARQKTILQRWIQEGAEYELHWSLIPPIRPKVPRTDGNPIDVFIVARLQREGLTLSPPADRATLVRRLYLDLTGLPP